MPGTFFARAALIAGKEKSKSQVATIATAPFEMSSFAFAAAVGLSDLVSIHSTLICLPRTPPALLIWLIRISNSCPDWRSYGARMPVFAAEMPIRIVPAFLLPSAVLRVKPALNARSVTEAPAIANRFLIVSPFVAAARRGRSSPSGDATRKHALYTTDGRLLGGPPPVHEDALAVDVPGGLGGEEDRRRSDVLDDPDAAEGRPVDHRAVV